MSQINNSHIPTHEHFLAYVKGKLSPKEKKSFEMAIESDAFLTEALEGYQKNPEWIGSVSNKVNANIQSRLPKSGLGINKFVFMTVAAVLVTLLTVFVLNWSSSETEITNSNNVVDNSNQDPDQQNTVVAPINNNENDLDGGDKEVPLQDQIPVDQLKELGKDDRLKDNEALINNEIQDDEDDEEIILNLNKKKSDKNKNDFKNQNSGSARLAVLDIAIAIKENPAQDGKTKTRLKNGQVITVDKTKNNKKYNQDDLPSFSGGDDALLSEIKGSIKPVVVNLISKYDRVIGFDFEVAANGKVDAKSLNFKGNPYPEIKAQIQKTVQNLPLFEPGKAKGNKGRIRYSIMLKY